jgi:FkbM family methyltransferase
MNGSSMKKQLVVYTVVMGGDYDLPSTIPQDGVDYICFTDQKRLEPNGWIVRNVSPLFPSDTFRSSRDMKTRPHLWLDEYSTSIYIDSTVHLKKDPLKLWDHLIPNESAVFGAFFHSFRETVADEFKAVAEVKLDYMHTIDEQLEAYCTHHRQTLSDKPVWGGMLARKHNSHLCINAMEIWFAHILRYSRRDQLSLPLALSHLPSKHKNIILADIHATEFHRWPVSSKPKPPGYSVVEASYVTRKYIKPMSIKLRKIRKFLKRSPQSPKGLPKGNESVIFGHDENLNLYFARDTKSDNRVFVSDRKRLQLYKGGITERQLWILRDYSLPRDLISKDDVVVDIGANIGELGLWVNNCGGRYIAFEPDPTAYLALQNNILNGDLYDVAISDSVGTADFYISTSEADSSLFKPSVTDDVITVRTATLDSFLEEVGAPAKIRLLKVEAEGMEPEVLAGAVKTLKNVEYIAVDAGPERGGANTVPGVFNILNSKDFEVVDCFLVRGTFLFRKRGTV